MSVCSCSHQLGSTVLSHFYYTAMHFSDFTLITSAEYVALEGLEFLGQTRVVDNIFYTCWQTPDGRKVKVEQELVPSYIRQALAAR